MRYSKTAYTLFAIILFSLNINSRDRRVITTAVPFLMISADARASGLGEQGVATSPNCEYAVNQGTIVHILQLLEFLSGCLLVLPLRYFFV